MKIHNEFSQNSVEWLLARAGVVTASEMDNLITPKGEPSAGLLSAFDFAGSFAALFEAVIAWVERDGKMKIRSEPNFP